MTDEVFWLAVGGLAQVGIVLTVPTSIWLYYRSEKGAREAARHEELLEKEQFQREERDKFYAQLDETYLRILQMIVVNPRLADASSARSRGERIQYDAFAFIMWNFIESIYDFCLNDEILRNTWHCVLECEGAAHAEWFNRGDSRKRFKAEFCDYIDGLATKAARAEEIAAA
jgi:hypothetical protein